MTTAWEGPAIVLATRPHGETSAIITLMTEALGRHVGLARGGQSRAQSAMWQQGNLVEAQWVARLSDQLGSLTAELIHPAAALAMEDALALGILAAACAVAEGALPERQPHPATFHGLVQLVVSLARTPDRAIEDLIRWEATLLAELGYGLDLTRCAATGATQGLAWVSPRTGRAVVAEAGAPYADRMLRLPAFLVGAGQGGPADWLDGLRLTGHFLAQDAFGMQNRALPGARILLQDRVGSRVSGE